MTIDPNLWHGSELIATDIVTGIQPSHIGRPSNDRPGVLDSRYDKYFILFNLLPPFSEEIEVRLAYFDYFIRLYGDAMLGYDMDARGNIQYAVDTEWISAWTPHLIRDASLLM